MPILLRNPNRPPAFRSQRPYADVVGINGHGLGGLQYAYRERCYGGEELQFRVRSARHRYSPLGDSYANAELRKLGLSGAKRTTCPNCFTELSLSNACECSDALGYFHPAN